MKHGLLEIHKKGTMCKICIYLRAMLLVHSRKGNKTFRVLNFVQNENIRKEINIE
jgi:hypothetical protein